MEAAPAPTAVAATTEAAAAAEAATSAARARLAARLSLRYYNANASSAPDAPSEGFTFVDHAADIGVDAWGSTLSCALAQCILGMSEYMCPDLRAQIAPASSRTLECEAHDLRSLLFAVLSDTLFLFAATGFVPCEARVAVLELGGLSATQAARELQEGHACHHGGSSAAAPDASHSESARSGAPGRRFFARWTLRGDLWRDLVHRQGTEVKAVTMHGLGAALSDEDGLWHVHAVLDI